MGTFFTESEEAVADSALTVIKQLEDRIEQLEQELKKKDILLDQILQRIYTLNAICKGVELGREDMRKAREGSDE